KKEDINRIMEIWFESTIKAHSFIYEKYWLENYIKVRDMYVPMSETFVYEEDNNIMGFISIIEKNFIGALFVDNNFFGKGIGSRLIDFALEKYKSLNLAVYKDNKNAVEFYKYKNFKMVCEQINEETGSIEYIMKSK
ncbi:N-acetyltransferase, partial [Terrisporobacter sp.]|uniref:N-acetyltransferase n=1 Tax=Terrisporobacter sp. TaxID=1965305 RepID=UPI002ED16A9F